MGELENMKLANANFKNYIFNKNRTLISKELFDEFALFEPIVAEDDYWGRWNQVNVDWLLEFIDKEKLK